MTPARWHEVTAVFHAALTREAGDRRAFVDQACAADPSLRAEVEAMLGAHAQASAAFGNGRTAISPGRRTVGDAPVLPPGTQLGAYRLDALLGGGGQACVYRAEDTQIGKAVAIKVLPYGWLDEPDRRARFEREARVLAALSHPNIATIHQLAEGDGHRGLVLELVEGPTLADRVAKGALPLEEALEIARQIALALEAAHDRGIVHRDLKPANIKVTASGVVKVLDFGLAKIVGEDAVPDSATALSIAGTREGLVMGTVAYMSPEQARGIPVDERTDLWSFGCVLYEMLAGRAAFRGDTISDTIVAVLERPVDFRALPSTTPTRIRRLLRRCLEKDVSRRIRNIGEVRAELDGREAGGTRREVARTVLRATALVALVWWFVSAPPTPEVADRSAERLMLDKGLQSDPTLRPDGQSLGYASNIEGNFELYTRRLNGLNATRITTNPADDRQPDWSIDDAVVFRSERDGGGIFLVPSEGGHEQQLTNFGYAPRWSPDGSRILFMRTSAGLEPYVLEVGAGTPTPRACEKCPLGAHGWFADSLHITTLSTDSRPPHAPGLRSTDSQSGKAIWDWTISAGVRNTFARVGLNVVPGGGLAWAADGKSLFFIGVVGNVHTIWELDVDPNARTVVGGPRLLTTNTEGVTSLSTSHNGDVTYAIATGDFRRGGIWLARPAR